MPCVKRGVPRTMAGRPDIWTGGAVSLAAFQKRVVE